MRAARQVYEHPSEGDTERHRLQRTDRQINFNALARSGMAGERVKNFIEKFTSDAQISCRKLASEQRGRNLIFGKIFENDPAERMIWRLGRKHTNYPSVSSNNDVRNRAI